MTENQIKIDYHILKDSVARQAVWPYSPLSTELVLEDTAVVERKPQQDIVTVAEWVNNETRIVNKKNTDKTITFRVRLGTYSTGEEE